MPYSPSPSCPGGACASGPGAGQQAPSQAHSGEGSGAKMNYMPGTASLIQDIDKKHLVLLRDGRTLIGYLRSIDQFGKPLKVYLTFLGGGLCKAIQRCPAIQRKMSYLLESHGHHF
nr:U6 snRNA-associated Sm-like protein LSm1 [Anolis sagrei ordinatus]